LREGASEEQNCRMRALLGLLIAAAVAVGFYYFYFTKTGPEGGTAGAIEAISTTAVKNDLNGIANAERMFFSQNGRYATWDELISTGTLRMEKPERQNYVYSIEASGSGFTVTARYTGPPEMKYPTLVIDQTMEIRETR
jgi:hypothetical protein